MSICLIRHTSIGLGPGICYGRSEVPLAEDLFADEVEKVRRNLPWVPERIVTSPSMRCRRLAEALCRGPVADPRLMELNFGTWEMRRWDSLPRAEIDSWGQDFVRRAPPDGETFAALAGRAVECISEYSDGIPTVVVTHAGVIRALLAISRGIELLDSFTLSVEYGGVYLLPAMPGGWAKAV
jgi:alpha-ribazole phosphatase